MKECDAKYSFSKVTVLNHYAGIQKLTTFRAMEFQLYLDEPDKEKF
jgi:hypothetical protein